MPPRKARAVREDAQCPMLKLIMEKGPLSGQIFDFKPGSVISIGRVVRGNTISIKDAGISSKHVLIQVEAPAGQRLWVITDLDSSNGTFLNGELLEPSAVVSDGDIIKIGEQTSIIVKFEANGVENESGSKNVRRNAARRGAKVLAANLGVIDELSELGLGNDEDEKKDEEVAEIEVKQERNVSTRRTRNSKKNEIVSNDLGLNEDREPEGVSTRRTRNSKKIVSDDLGLSEARETEGMNTRRTRNSRKEEEAPVTVIDSSVIEGKKMGKGGRGRKKLPAKTIPEETEKEEEEDGLNKSVEGLNTSQKDAGLGSTSGVKESNVNSGKGKIVVDLENMTLGQWFDFLEVYFPQQIIDESEVMIAEMRGKAERFHEYLLEQKKANRENEVGKS